MIQLEDRRLAWFDGHKSDSTCQALKESGRLSLSCTCRMLGSFYGQIDANRVKHRLSDQTSSGAEAGAFS